MSFCETKRNGMGLGLELCLSIADDVVLELGLLQSSAKR